jgi:hypothetical protein
MKAERFTFSIGPEKGVVPLLCEAPAGPVHGTRGPTLIFRSLLRAGFEIAISRREVAGGLELGVVVRSP